MVEWISKKTKKLGCGDEIYWEDPDDGICSRFITIQNISLAGEAVCIKGKDGSYLECFPHELK
jgi:hypothetical protein